MYILLLLWSLEDCSIFHWYFLVSLTFVWKSACLMKGSFSIQELQMSKSKLQLDGSQLMYILDYLSKNCHVSEIEALLLHVISSKCSKMMLKEWKGSTSSISVVSSWVSNSKSSFCLAQSKKDRALCWRLSIDFGIKGHLHCMINCISMYFRWNSFLHSAG